MGISRSQNRTHVRKRFHIPEEKAAKDPSWFAIIFLCVIQLYPISALLLGKRLLNGWRRKKKADYRTYASIIADRCEVSINELSAKLGKTPSLVRSDLQTMIEKGYLGSEAYIDHNRDVLVLEVVESEFVDERKNAQESTPLWDSAMWEKAVEKHTVKVELTPEEEPEPARAEPAPQPMWREDEFEEKLKQIRRLNDEIADEEVSERIDRIGELTASIFAVVREQPDRADEVKKFMNYYLPTTLKLLKSYALMEKQSYQGSNIVASRKKIEDILDTLIAAFEQQQDRLFRTEAMDVEADIEVLETMMAKDGLVTPKGSDLRSVMGGH